MIRVSSHQPSFFPWAGYWSKVQASDLLIMSAGVKFDYAGYQNRVQIDEFWWTLPVEGDAKNKLIKDVRFKKDGLGKVMRTARQQFCSKKNSFRDRVELILDRVTEAVQDTDSLLVFNVAAFEAVHEVLGLSTKWVVDLEPPTETLSKTDRLVERITRFVPEGPVDYLAGAGAVDYINAKAIPDRIGISIQRVREGSWPGTILKALSQQKSPLALLESASDFDRLKSVLS